MSTHYFIAASEKFLTVEEPLEELLKERTRNYAENEKNIDFWLVTNPAFLQTPELEKLTNQIPKPSAAVISTDEKFINFLKLRLEFVVQGQFESPSASIPNPLAQS